MTTTEWWVAGVVICLQQGADLHMAQLMPLPLTVSCFSKIQIGFTFLVPAHPGSPGKRAIKWVCVCHSATYNKSNWYILMQRRQYMVTSLEKVSELYNCMPVLTQHFNQSVTWLTENQDVKMQDIENYSMWKCKSKMADHLARRENTGVEMTDQQNVKMQDVKCETNLLKNFSTAPELCCHLTWQK